MAPTVGFSKFAKDNVKAEKGNSFTILKPAEVCRLVQVHWADRRPANHEPDDSRKVLVPMGEDAGKFFCPPRVPLTLDLPIKARVTQRQPGEDPYIDIYTDLKSAQKRGYTPQAANKCDIVVYSAAALLENGGTRTTDCEFEVVSILAYKADEEEWMSPLTMARNYLQKPGGTFADYTAEEFAQAIYNHSTNRTVRIMADDKK